MTPTGRCPRLHITGECMNKKTIFALGFFDGVHLGHAALLQACRRLGEETGCDCGVVTFHNHPDALVHGTAPGRINTTADRDWLLERYGTEYEAIFSNRHYLEITRKGSTKGGMVDKLVRHLGVEPGHVYCVGDNQNDIPMLARSAIPFAPANCAQEVKDWGATVLCHCNDGVIGDIMEILDKRY